MSIIRSIVLFLAIALINLVDGGSVSGMQSDYDICDEYANLAEMGTTALTWHQTENLLAVAYIDVNDFDCYKNPRITIYDGTNNTQVNWPSVDSIVYSIAWHPTLPLLARTYENSIRIIDVTNLTEVQVQLDLAFPIASLDWSPNGSYLAAGGFDDNVYIIRTSDYTVEHGIPGRMRGLPGVDIQATRVRWSPSGDRISVGYAGGKLIVYDTQTFTSIQELQINQSRVFLGEWSPNGRYIVGRDDEQGINVYDTQTQSSQSIPNLHQGKVIATAWRNDGLVLATTSEDGSVRFWNTLTWELLYEIPKSGNTALTLSIDWSVDDAVAFGTWQYLSYGSDGSNPSVIIPPGDLQRLTNNALDVGDPTGRP